MRKRGHLPAALLAALRRASGRLLPLLCAAVLLGGLGSACLPDAAHAVRDELGSLNMTCDEAISLGRLDVVRLPASTSPDAIEVGVQCGMVEMCGQDPCLCGSVDEWGACACNGRETVYPTYEMTFEGEALAAVFQLFDTAYVVALGTGEADAVVTASFPHHELVSTTVHVTVAPFGVLDVLKVLAALVVLAVLLGVVLLVVRAVMRAVCAAARRMRARRSGTSDMDTNESKRASS